MLSKTEEQLVKIDDDFLPEYKGKSVDFYQDMQEFHDDKHNWIIATDSTIVRLSNLGKKHVDRLKLKYQE